MLVNDILIFIYNIIKAEFKRVKRLMFIIALGSFLVFLITMSSSILKTKVRQAYSNRYVLMPYKLNSDIVLLEESEVFLNSSMKDNIKSRFNKTQFIETNKTESAEVLNINQNENKTVFVGENIYSNDILINEDFMKYSDWTKNDKLVLDATLLEIDGYHTHYEYELLLPSKMYDAYIETSNDNIITLITDDNIDEIVSYINTFFTAIEYKLEDIALDELVISLLTLVESVILTFSLVIFLVSSSNIGTIMPYFINEFQDEILLLRIMGLDKKSLENIFLYTTCTLLFISLCISLFFSFSLSFLFSILAKSKFDVSLFKLSFLFIIQIITGLLFSHKSIKKATDYVAYI